MFHAQIESCKDVPALRAFLGAVERYQALSATERERRHDLRKYYVRSLYAGARSALRLGPHPLARQAGPATNPWTRAPVG